MASAHEDQAREQESIVGKLGSQPEKLGDLLKKKAAEGVNVKVLFQKIDKNGDGKISKMEFRQWVREQGLMGGDSQYTSKDVDAIFMEMDVDKGGDIDVHELSAALSKLVLRSKEVAEAERKATEEAEKLRKKAEAERSLAKKVEAWETATAKLREMRDNPTVETLVASLVVQRGLKPQDLLDKWDADHNKNIEISEFHKGLEELGVAATAEEIDALFATIDTDGSGGIDYDELKSAVKHLYEAKQSAMETEAQLAKQVKELDRSKNEAQHEIRVMLAEEERQKAEAEAAAAAAAEAARLAAEAAEAEAKAKEAAIEAAKAKKKEEWDKKIEERRAARNDIHAAIEQVQHEKAQTKD